MTILAITLNLASILQQPAPIHDMQPSVGPNGQVVFISTRNTSLDPDLLFQQQDRDVYLVNLDGSGLRRLTETPDIREESPTFLTGNRILYSGYGLRRRLTERPNGVYVLDLREGTASLALEDAWSPSPDPDGKAFVCMARSSGIWGVAIKRLDTGFLGFRTDKIKESVALLEYPGGGALSDGSPVFTPDGKQIIWASLWRADGRETWFLFIMDRSGQNKRNLGIEGHSPAISPDGKSVACVRRVQAPNGNWYDKIYTADISGVKIKPIGRIDSEWDEASPCFTPDGKRIVFASNRTGSWRLYVSGVDGLNPPPRPLIPEPD